MAGPGLEFRDQATYDTSGDALKTGDCFDFQTERFRDVLVVKGGKVKLKDCSGPHHAEMTGRFVLSDFLTPSERRSRTFATCEAALRTYLGGEPHGFFHRGFAVGEDRMVCSAIYSRDGNLREPIPFSAREFQREMEKGLSEMSTTTTR